MSEPAADHTKTIPSQRSLLPDTFQHTEHPEHPYSLNNVTGNAHTQTDIYEIHDNIDYSGISGVLGTGYKSVKFLDSSYLIRSRAGNQKEKSEALKRELKRKFPDHDFTDDYWNFIAAFKDAAISEFKIRNNENRQLRRWNYNNCHWVKTKGEVHVTVDGGVYHDKMSCGEPGCILCAEKKRKRLGQEHLEILKGIIDKHPKIPGLLKINFTLPASIEGKPLYDGNQGILLKSIQAIVRKLFGRKLRNRSNIALWMHVHPVGSSDYFRDRWHVHVDILPCEIDYARDENGKIIDKAAGKQLFVLHPSKVLTKKKAELQGKRKTYNYHTPYDWKLDLPWLRRQWHRVLRDLYGVQKDLSNPQVDFIPFNPKSRYWKHPKRNQGNQTFKEKLFAKLGHSLRYNARAIAVDVTKNVLRNNFESRTVILKAHSPLTRIIDVARQPWDISTKLMVEKSILEMWQSVKIYELVKRYRFVNEKNKLQSFGFFRCLNRYADILGLKTSVSDDGKTVIVFTLDDQGEQPEILYSAVADVWHMVRKVYDSKRRRVVTESLIRYVWENPDGEIMELNQEETKKWVW